MDWPLNQIICGDALEVMKSIADNSVHLAITSPPYNVGKDYDSHDDNMDYQEYLGRLMGVWKEMNRLLVPGGRFALNIAPTGISNFIPLHHDFSNQLRSIGMKLRAEIIWYKQTMLRRTAWGSFKSPSNPHLIPSWEYVLVFSKGQTKLDGVKENADITRDEFIKFSDGMWHIPPETQRHGHPAPFPEELVYRLIKYYSYRGNTVLDMFGGTGTVAAVAYKTGRNFIHIDVSHRYCEIAEKRLEKVKAVLNWEDHPSRLSGQLPQSLARATISREGGGDLICQIWKKKPCQIHPPPSFKRRPAMSSLVDDLRRFRSESAMSPEDMAQYLRLQFRLNPEAFSSDETPSESGSGKGKRGRKKQVPPEKPAVPKESAKSEQAAVSA